MSDVDLASMDIMMGKGQVGGKPKRRGPKTKTVKKTKGKSVKRVSRGGFFFSGTPMGDEWKCSSCVKVAPPENPVVVSTAQAVSDIPVKLPEAPKLPVSQAGGSANVRAIYKKKLDALSVEQLRKMAVTRGISITKRKDGKTVYVKKATIVQKLCDFKHGKRA